LNDDLKEVNVFDNVNLQRAETFAMDVVIWTKSQVLENQRTSEPVTITDIQLEYEKVWIISNENDQRFKCVTNLEGTNPGKKVLKMMIELDKCKTILNEIPYDDLLTDEKIIQLVKKVR
jgi:hypothetical protein